MSRSVRVHVPNDYLSVRLDCVVEPGEEDAAVAEVLAEAEKLGIKPALTAESVKGVLLPALANGTRVINLELATGRAPVPPTDGKVAW
ncbi:MAG: hypothetical protein FJY92_08620, partial [Candidatus Hydrogenedentes bacterium]|nr:hypothetical protein [Candidatus Hydrogenedentota bacterium]